MNNLKVTVKKKIHCAKNGIAGPIKVLKTFFVEFCDNSSIHGVRYFTERQLHWSERLWWLIAIAVSLWMCGSLTRNIWDGWNENPVTFSFNEREEPVAAIPFPQITICSETQIPVPISDIVDAFKFNTSMIQEGLLKTLVQICPRLQMEQHIELTEIASSETIYWDIKAWYQYRNGFISGCMFPLSSLLPCNLGLVLTEQGMCATFNDLHPSSFYTDEIAPKMKTAIGESNKSDTNWHFETPFNYSRNETGYPIHTRQYGRESSIMIELGIGLVSQQCNGLERGFKLALNMPGESVKISKNSIRIPPGEDTRLILSPKLTYTADELRNYRPNQRLCYFNSERRLRFYKIYSQSSCEEECLANFTKIDCGCVKFNMPRDNKTRICGGAKMNCYKSSELKYFSSMFREQCNCLPSCTTIEYNVKIERSQYNIEATENEEIRETGIVWVYYGNEYITTVKRIPLYTYLDFLANCGGFFGVCLGASALSIIELIYFASLRVYWTNHTSKSMQIFTLIKQKLSELRLIRGIRWFFNELCDNSNIHGILYFTRIKLHWSERLFWILSVGVSIWMSYSLIYDFWLQWNEHLVMLSFSKSPDSISTIPLPTITICSSIKSLTRRLNGTTFTGQAFKENREYFLEKIEFHALFQIWIISAAMKSVFKFKTDQIESESIYDAIHKISPQLNETMSNCWWRNKPIECWKYFVPILTQEGLCFAFNALNSDDIHTNEMASGMKTIDNIPRVNNWNFQNGYTNEPSESDYPMRLLDSDEKTTVKISLSFDSDEIDFFYRIIGSEFKVFLSTPGDLIQFSSKFHQVSLLNDVRITISPKKTTTSAGLRGYTPKQRQCYFESERRLKFFKIYTQSNCEQECLANHFINQFGCVKFSFPRDKNTSICGLGKQKLFTPEERVFSTDGRVLEVYGQESIREKCNCLPTCTTIEYNVDIDATQLHSDGKNTEWKNGRQVERAELTISFENSVEIVERIETYTFAEFLAICGGLLGLFMGISALSIIELIYFCTLRWFWKLRRERADNAVEILGTRTVDVTPYDAL